MESLFEKLAHPLPEVRHRALRSLQFKLQHGLLVLGNVAAALGSLLAALDLCCTAAADSCAGLPGSAKSEAVADLQAVLELLRALLQQEQDQQRQPGTLADQLLQLGADQALIRVADVAPSCTQLATALLGQLLCQRGQAPQAHRRPFSPVTVAANAASTVAACVSTLCRWTASTCQPPPPSLGSGWCSGPEPSPPPRLSPEQLPCSPGLPNTAPDPMGCWRGATEGVPAASMGLSEEDSQQLFDVALELGAESADEAALLAALSTLRHGVLADMPAAAVASEPALVESLLRLLDGGHARPRVAAAALQALAALAGALLAEPEAASADAEGQVQGTGSTGSSSWGKLAHAGLLRCAPLCSDRCLRHEALAAASALVPLLPPEAMATSTTRGGPGSKHAAGTPLAPLLQALTDALRLSLVADCTDADVPPPSDWATGFHALVLGPGSCGILRVVAALLERMPSTALEQALPPELCDILVALASSPVVPTAAPDLHGFARSCLPSTRPAAVAQLQTVADLRRQQAEFLSAVQQLAGAPSPALAAACCREVQQQLAALELQSAQECHRAVHVIVEAASRHAAAPPAATLVAALLLHSQPQVRQAALEAAAQLVSESAGGIESLLVHPPVASSLVLALSDEPCRQQLAAELLQAVAAAGDTFSLCRAFSPWESWLLCHASQPTTGPAVASVLQAVATHKQGVWQQAAPLLLALFHSSAAAEAAAQLHALLVQLHPAAAGAMLFNPLPFDGMLLPVGVPEGGGHFDAEQAAAAAAAKLFTAADVQSLLAVIGNPELPPELTAAALGQLAQVAGDPRFAAVLIGRDELAMLLAQAMEPTAGLRVQQPALDCLAALLEQQPAAVEWLLAEPDQRIVPLLPLVFHVLPARRQAMAKLLHHLLFGTAASQLGDLAAGMELGIGRRDGAASSMRSASRRGPLLAVPEPFCASFLFPAPASVLPVWPASSLEPAGSSNSNSSLFGRSDQVQRLWRAQQLCTAAANGSTGSVGLVQLLSPSASATLPRWELDLVCASLAMLKGLRADMLAPEGLAALAASQDHRQCHAALHSLKLLATPTAVPEGAAALAAAAWQEPLRFLLAAAPISPDDCLLWLEMLPLLQELLAAAARQQAQQAQPHLLALAQQFVGGSSLGWVQEQGSQQGMLHLQAALLPEVLMTVRQIVQQGMHVGSSSQRQHLLEAMRCQDWLAVLPLQLQNQAGSYASRVAALQLAAALVSAQASLQCSGSSGAAGPQAVQLFGTVARQALMPRHLWGTQPCHGKAAVRAALELLHLITQVAPAEDWAAAWVDLGTTFWLSRAAADSSRHVRAGALRLLAAAVAVPATHGLLQQAWPECGNTATEAALDASSPVDIRTAALSMVAAALSHGLTEHQAAAAADADVAAGGAEAAGSEAEQEATSMQLVLLPPPSPPLSAEALLRHEELWDAVHSILQEAAEPDLLSAAAHAALQRLLLDAEGAQQLAYSGTLQRLFGLQIAVATQLGISQTAGLGTQQASSSGPPPTVAAADTQHGVVLLQHAVQAAQAAAGMVALQCQLGQPVCSSLLPAASAAFSTAVSFTSASLAEVPGPAIHRLRQACWAALPVLADAVTLLLQAGTATPEEVRAACSCQPLPLAAAVAAALGEPPLPPDSLDCAAPDSSVEQLRQGCCRLLAAVLAGAAASFLLDGSGEEHQLQPAAPGPCNSSKASQPVGAPLCMRLIDWFVGAAAEATAADRVLPAAEDGCAAGPDQAEQQGQAQEQQQLVLNASLGGLLAHSHSAKQVALEVGLHTMLVDGCQSLAGSSGAPAEQAARAVPAVDAPTGLAPGAAAASRASKLQQLKNRRGGGGGAAAKAQPRAQLAFRTRLPGRGRHAAGSSPGNVQREQQGQPPASSPAAPASSSPQAPPGPPSKRQQQRLLQLLSLLQQLAYDSPACCNALAAAGVVELAHALLEAGPRAAPATAVQHSMLSLLGCVLSNSQPARHACATRGEPPLLERLVGLALSARTPLATASAAASALSRFAATPDGAHTLIHSTSLSLRSLHQLQDGMAGKDWKRLVPTLQLLADLCSQPEGQRAVLRCTAPSGDMLSLLLELAAQQRSSSVAEAAMLVVRQVALHTEAKAQLGSKAGALQGMVDAVAAAAAQPGRAAAAAHALWALLFGSGGERLKVALRRCERWAESLQAGLAACRREPGASWAAPLQQACDALHQLLS